VTVKFSGTNLGEPLSPLTSESWCKSPLWEMPDCSATDMPCIRTFSEANWEARCWPSTSSRVKEISELSSRASDVSSGSGFYSISPIVT
jgi:hypothetical protein